MKNIVLVGATGLIGSHLLRRLSVDCSVYAVTRKPLENNVNIKNVLIDLNANESFNLTELPNEADTVIYLAQSEYFREFPEKAVDMLQVNTVSMLRFLDYSKQIGARRFIYASSGGVYGHGFKSFSEDLIIPASGDLGFYLSTKLCSEILAQNYQQFLSVVLLRFFFVYGKGQNRGMLIPRLVDNVRAKKPVQLQGQDGISINPTHVSDVVEAIAAALNIQESGKYNIAGPEILTLREICNVIGKKINVEPIFDINNDVQPNDLIGDVTKMKEALWNPVITLEQGLDSVI